MNQPATHAQHTNRPDTGRPQRRMYDQDGPAVSSLPAPREGRRAQPPHKGARPVYRTKKAAEAATFYNPVRPRQGGKPRPRKGVAQTSARAAARTQRAKRRRRVALIVVYTLLFAIVMALATGFTLVTDELMDGGETDGGNLPDAVRPQAIPEYTGKGIICGLICGIDYNNEDASGYVDEGNKIGNTDLIMYMMYNTKTGECNILRIPRDTYVGPYLQAGSHHKINGLYYWAPDPDNRMAALASMLYDQLGLPTDFYITIDMDAVKEIVDIKGSITVYVAQDVVGKDQYGNLTGTIEKGWRHLDSATVELFLRSRNYATADLERIQMQNSFFSALFREFKTLSTNDLLMWMRVLMYRCNIGGIGPWQLTGLAIDALQISGDNITFIRPPVTGATMEVDGQTVSLVCLVPDETAELLNTYFRPDGHTLATDELEIYTLPIDPVVGYAPAAITTMSQVQETEQTAP